MGNLLASLISSAQTLRVYDRALNVVQNNVGNAQTPGWARQVQSLQAKSFDPAAGIIGGVADGGLLNGRNELSEQAVRQRAQSAGYAGERAQDLAQVEPVLSIAAGSGVAGALAKFFDSVTQWSVNPNDNGSRQVVLDRAGTVSRSFNEASNGLVGASRQLDSQVNAGVAAINRISGAIRTVNQERRQSVTASQDAGLEAKLYSSLEELSEYVDFTALPQPDGSVSIFAGGQVPLVIGDRQYALDVDDTGEQTKILNSQGNDVTRTIGNGRLKGLLDTRNGLVPVLRSGLDRLAESFADQVNATLAQGRDANGGIPTVGLFSYQGEAPAATLAISGITAQQLAGASSAAPGGNDNILEIAKLGTTQQVEGLTFTQYYGSLSALVGRELTSAKDDKQTRDDLLSQARSLREDLSGVSLDEEAVKLLELQRGYQATAKLLSTLNDLTAVVLDLLH